ncbi:AbrB/MazE/SpoVT family DNA-binding domain-containing protein [Sulfurisphaera ohwakuensis]|uniref:AbrB/MazE/SpoVT family DNA-binding domain-containing protein n=1 Tax=Sulfurisphaera ohwakuensis TaxID=69656 RepID=A0A650CJB6_SULOH|nr:AbrB/MazE/SpoVT family DNA-binding domain-containing protein [Sulfurisphaera ohwakuensis]MBB5253512.1 bifunctional DNA-binding transcriptional regulator/antitoxin component of YhaV-PrlF toxin-antitoxin module [Sulfurisphaera ohwakuensis]QGR17818.1 AbrB/MazE/SpoVT family DNA-binding domain-containing protein [Sulfurisphaera ohwakuensis]
MVKLSAKKGGRGEETYYLNVPREIVKSLGLSKGDEFILSVETKDGEIILCYKRVKKST